MADERLAKTHGRLTVAEARALMALFDEGVCDKEPVSETVKVSVYRPKVPVSLLEQYRKTMEDQLAGIDSDIRLSCTDQDWDAVKDLADVAKAFEAAIDLMTAEIRRCES